MPTIAPILAPTSFLTWESGWFSMSANAGSSSYQNISHTLGQYPDVVRVLVKVAGCTYGGYTGSGFIFQGMGSTMDPETKQKGGVVYGFDDSEVRLWSPDGTLGTAYMALTADGWGGEACTTQEQTADINIIAHAGCAASDYDSGWFTMESQAGTDSFKEVIHGLGALPEEVRVLVRATDGSNSGFIFKSSGSQWSDDDPSRNYGGLISGYNDISVRLWAPGKTSTSLCNGKLFSD